MRGLTHWIAQVSIVSTLGLRTIPRRAGASLAAAFGVAGVVAVMVSVLSIGEGFRRTLASTGSPDSVIVMRSGTDTEMNSILMLEDTRIVSEAPGVRRGAGGPVASAELFVVIDVPMKSRGTAANVPLRGVGPAAFEVRERFRIVQGRNFEPGRNEVIVGVQAAAQFVGLEVGDTLRTGKTEWTVVGQFEAGGSVSESEIWCDAKVLQPAYQRGDSFQSVYARLESPEAFDEFKDALTSDPRLDVDVRRESEYFAEQSEMLHGLITALGFTVALLMAIGAAFGAINTMYSAVSARSREIATLRALGFRAGPVVVSILAESMFLALAGGLVGAVVAYAAFNGYQAATINWQTFSQVAFRFAVTPGLLVSGLVFSLLIGLAGGLFPAIRAARQPVATALRAL